MHIDQQNLRTLHDSLFAYSGSDAAEDLLWSWMAASGDVERAWLAAFAARTGSPVPEASVEDLWRLYAFSRVNDILVLGFQPAPVTVADYEWPERPVMISLAQYAEFMTALGFTPFHETAFHPFYHEIVEVEPADAPDTPATIVRVLWPGWSLGPMLFSRAGCIVRSGRNIIVKEVAESSTLYWTYRRRNRPCEDLSCGWGHNSQWRTSYRRDYRLGNRLYYNVAGTLDVTKPDTGENPDPDREKLTVSERVEFLIHRCFVRTPKPHKDLWVYDDHYEHDLETM